MPFVHIIDHHTILFVCFSHNSAMAVERKTTLVWKVGSGMQSSESDQGFSFSSLGKKRKNLKDAELIDKTRCLIKRVF